jgi:hypothetical protein
MLKKTDSSLDHTAQRAVDELTSRLSEAMAPGVKSAITSGIRPLEDAVRQAAESIVRQAGELAQRADGVEDEIPRKVREAVHQEFAEVERRILAGVSSELVKRRDQEIETALARLAASAGRAMEGPASAVSAAAASLVSMIQDQHRENLAVETTHHAEVLAAILRSDDGAVQRVELARESLLMTLDRQHLERSGEDRRHHDGMLDAQKRFETASHTWSESLARIEASRATHLESIRAHLLTKLQDQHREKLEAAAMHHAELLAALRRSDEGAVEREQQASGVTGALASRLGTTVRRMTGAAVVLMIVTLATMARVWMVGGVH